MASALWHYLYGMDLNEGETLKLGVIEIKNRLDGRVVNLNKKLTKLHMSWGQNLIYAKLYYFHISIHSYKKDK